MKKRNIKKFFLLIGFSIGHRAFTASKIHKDPYESDLKRALMLSQKEGDSEDPLLAQVMAQSAAEAEQYKQDRLLGRSIDALSSSIDKIERVEKIGTHISALMLLFEKADEKTKNNALKKITAQVEAKKQRLGFKEYALLTAFLENALKKEYATKPALSFDSGTSQFGIGDSGSACGAMTLVAMEELKEKDGDLVQLKKRYGNSLDTILSLGKSAYGDIINKLKRKSGAYLNAEEIESSDLFKTYNLKKQTYEQFLINKAHISQTILSLLTSIEKNSAIPLHAAAAAGARDSHNVYGMVTFSGTTIMITFIPVTKTWILFDSHRRDKYEAQGSGYHQFTSKQAIADYLTSYPGLTYDDSKKEYQNLVEINMFS